MSTAILPTRLSDEAVAALQARYTEAVDRLVDTALAGHADAAAKRADLRDYVVTAARYGRVVEPKVAAELANLSQAQMQERRSRLHDPLPGLSRAVARFAGWMRNDASRHDDVFGDKDRLYFPLPRDTVFKTQREVTALLQNYGYTVTDYAGGYATDDAGKQQFRIGKLLNKLAPYHAESYQNDSTRSGSAMMICLTRDPEDVARMSTGRNWKSCMGKGGLFYGRVKTEIAKGSLVAYMVSENDPEITRPLARITVKPFSDGEGHTVMRAATAYGLSDEVFERTVERLADDLSAGAPSGRYRIKGGVYADNLPESVQKLGADLTAQQFLTRLGVDFEEHADGRIEVADYVLAFNRDLTELPDLTMVDFHQGVSLSNNRLTSLKGLPKAMRYHLHVDGNLLTSLDGAPEVVGGHFVASNNRLTSLDGAPRHVGQDFDVSGNQLADARQAPAHIGGEALLTRNPLTSLAGLGMVKGEVRSDLGQFDSSATVPERLRTPRSGEAAPAQPRAMRAGR